MQEYKIVMDVLDQQRAGVEWQDICGAERIGTKQDRMEEIVTGFLGISCRTSIVKTTLKRGRITYVGIQPENIIPASPTAEAYA